MAKKQNISVLQPDPLGPKFGPVNDPAVIMKLQQNFFEALFEYLKATVVPASADPQVAGFEATLTDGLSVSVASGIALDVEGHLYGSTSDDPTVVQMAAADPANPRIDLIVATLAEDVPVDLEFTPFRRLRTEAEVEEGVPPYQAVQLNVPKELHSLATITVKQGVTAAVPVSPAAGENEVPLWQVRVNAGVVALQNDKLTDVRNIMPHLGQIASSTKLGVIKVGPHFAIALDGTLSISNITELVQDALITFFPDASPFDWTVDDPNNRVILDVAVATTVLKGLMSAADKAKLDASTSAATASALMQRDSNGDVIVRDGTATRDLKAGRNHVFADNSIMPSAARGEEIVPIITVETNFNIGAGVPGETVVASHSAIGTGSHPIEIHIKVEDYTNIPVCFEAVCAPNVAGGSIQLQLYNATDGVVLATISKSTSQDPTPRVSRSAAFNFTGTGRKRLVLRGHSSNDSVNGCVTTVWRARLILNPAFTTCGMDALAACPV